MRTLHLTAPAARRIREEIARARGNEVCFVAAVGEEGAVREPRVVARGHRTAVVAALAGVGAGALVIHNHPSGELDPSDPDLELAAELSARGIGLAITDNLARELYVVVEPAQPRRLVPLEEDEVEALLAPGGPLARAHGAYEDRPAQRAMARLVARTYNQGGIALAEAGTGTGKSVAYLVPAILWAVRNGERTVVSTNTIVLQEQLIGKDLPLLRRALGAPFRFALVKGRTNYVSIRRARLAAEAQAALFDGGQRAELDAILAWLDRTRDGSLQDLPFTPQPEVWDEVASESDVCLRARCPHFEACFYQRARRDAAAADVLVVNHHLLFSDLALRRAQGNYTAPAVLPPYRRVILDEAHNLEAAATAHLGASLSGRSLLRLLGRLDRRGRGLLAAVEERLAAAPPDLLQTAAFRQIAEEVRPAVERARERAVALFDRLAALAATAEDGVLRLGEGGSTEGHGVEEAVAPEHEGLALGLEELARALERLGERVRADERWREALEPQLLELQAMAGRLRAALDALRLALRPGPDAPELVRWVERRAPGPGREPAVVLRAAPVEPGALLREALFERVETAVLTSATLATRDGFDFLRGRLGLDRGGLPVESAVYPSPFDFEEQTLLAIATDLPEPGAEESSAAFDRAVADVLEELVAVSDGGVLVLFTSYRSLRAVAADLRQRGVDGRWPLLVQGEAPRGRLLSSFTASGRAVLLGVASFWEGVDVPGEPLRGLVVAKLPFLVPTEPVTAARIEAIAREGGNPFREYVLPEAALRLKQGFGRLVRSRADHGAVVLLDRRVVTRSYGRYFLESLPPAPVHAGPWRELRPLLRAFYDR